MHGTYGGPSFKRAPAKSAKAGKGHPPTTPLEKDMVALMKKRNLKTLAASPRRPVKK
jgi:hypothetical protein